MVKEKLNRNRLFFLAFAALAIQTAIYMTTTDIADLIQPYYYPMYAIDFSVGVCSRALIGSVISLFADKIDVYALNVALLAVHIVGIFLICLFLNSCYKINKSDFLFVFCVVLLFSVNKTLLDYMGIMDIYWILGAAACILIVNRKYLRWLIPLICTLCFAAHNAFVLTYMPVVLLAVLYVCVKNPTKSNAAFLAFCVLTVGAAAVYFVFIGDGTVRLTEQELVEYLNRKLPAKSEDEYWYILYSLYGTVPDKPQVQGFGNYISFMLEFTRDSLSDNNSFFYRMIVLCLAGAVPFYMLIVKMIKKSSGVFEKITLALTFLFIPLNLLATLLSTDTERFVSSFLLVMMMFVMLLIRNRDAAFSESLGELKQLAAKHKVPVAAAAIIVINFILDGGGVI